MTSESIRRWKGTKDGVLLPGKATLLRAAGDRVLACIEGKAVAAIDPSKDGTAWVVPEPANAEVGDVIGLEPAGDGVLLTYQSGLVREVNLAKGTVVAEAARTLGAPFVATAAVPAGKTLLLIPSSDGSFGFGSLNK